MVVGYKDPSDICTFNILKIVRIIKLDIISLKTDHPEVQT